MFHSAAAHAAQIAAAQTHQLLVGGLLMEVNPEGFQELCNRSEGALVLTGRTKTAFFRRWKERLYFMPHQGITFYCKVGPEETLPLSQAVEVTLKLGPLSQLI